MSRSALSIAGISLVGGLLAYAAYFDYRRRHDSEFRKRLRREQKQVERAILRERLALGESGEITNDDLRAALEVIRKEEPPPRTIEAREQYFMTQVSLGEQLALQGPAFFMPAALSFYRALRVYPSPVELMVIYQKTMPEPVFKIVMEMTNLDTKERVEGYYEVFPAKPMNVSVKTVDVKETQMRKKILVASKDFSKGDIIYKEHPVVTALDFDLQGKGTHCFHCLRQIQKGMGIRLAADPLDSVYCSKDCQVKAKVQYHNLIFGLEPLIPSEVTSLPPSETTGERRTKQMAFVAYLKQVAKTAPLLLVKFLARQVAVEMADLVPGADPTYSSELPQLDSGSYTLYDHIERLRFLEVTVTREETTLLNDVLKLALPGLEQFLTDERHPTLLGKMGYNMYGICFGEGRDDKPPSTEPPENVEKTRTPHGTSRQIGSGLYTVSSYISHSCSPTAQPSFSSGTAELHLVANGDIKKGDEITVAYVDVSQHADESPVEARRRRRTELARGWRFACVCSRCVSEMAGDPDATDEVSSHKDESKVEPAVTRVDAFEGQPLA